LAAYGGRFDVAVIGGGIVGLYTALDLTLRDFKVVLLERGAIGSGTSGGCMDYSTAVRDTL
jgi:glycine/D-amino acid oxidase-like deaminating enzyme